MHKDDTRIDKKLSNTVYYLIVCLFSFGFLSVFSYSTTPFLSTYNGTDAGFFRIVGQGMTKGYLPYRDFFDMKGPLLFFIQYAGQLLAYGRWGIFIIQWINLFVTLVIICRLFDKHDITNHLFQFCLLLPVIYIACFTFRGGNLTEEYSLIPLLSCLSICLEYFEKSEQSGPFWQHWVYWCAGFGFGFCFGLLAMIRITNAALIGAMILAVAFSLLKDQRYQKLLICFGTFLLGFCLSLLPAFFYFKANELIHEAFESVVVLGYKYSSEKTIWQHITEMVFNQNNQQLLLIIVPCVIPFLTHWRSWKERMLFVLCVLLTFWAIASGNNYTHYYTLTIPLFVLSEIAIIESWQHSRVGIGQLFAIILIISALLLQIPLFTRAEKKAINLMSQQEKYNYKQTVQDIASKIPDEDKHSVFCYNIDPSWYSYTDLFPCIKYCGWQNHYFSLMPEVYADFEELFLLQPPVWLVLPNSQDDPLPDFLVDMIDVAYHEVYNNERYLLYHYSNDSEMD